ITFLTFFMLLEGPAWLERVYSLLPEKSQPRWRAVGHEIYRTVGGYVSGNLLISLIAGVTYGIVLFIFGVPYAVALALIVVILDWRRHRRARLFEEPVGGIPPPAPAD